MINSKRLGSVILASLVIALVGAVGAVFPAPSSRYTIRIDRLSVAFDVPKGFAVLQDDLVHGPWATIISFGQEFRPGHLRSAPLQLVFWPAGYDGTKTVPEYTPSQYVDAEFKRVKEGVRQRLPGFGWEPEYVKLFGNKAVRYTVGGLGSDTVIVGYLRADQVPESISQEYLARIGISADIPGPEFKRMYKNLVDTVVNSLRTAH